MPVKSGPQARLFMGVAKGNIKKPGLSKEVAKEFIAATPRTKLREYFKGHPDHAGSKGK